MLPQARARVINSSTLAENGGAGGSFCLGAMPKTHHQPAANKAFPELLEAAFELETLLCPHRSSSTIAVNKHAAFKPHKVRVCIRSVVVYCGQGVL